MNNNNMIGVYTISKYTDPDPLPDFSYEILLDSYGQEYVHFCSDIDYLLGTKSIEHLDPTLVRELFAAHDSSSPSSESPVSDDDLFNFCKSRFIQEPADVSRWCDHLKNVAERLRQDTKDKIDEIVDYVNQQREAVDANRSVVSPSESTREPVATD